jgi:hypothetical protein
VINLVFDHYRFGVFSYPGYSSVKDGRIYMYLPIDAKDITIDKKAQGFRAKFQISKKELDQWFDDHWKKEGNDSIFNKKAIDIEAKVNNKLFMKEYGNLKWTAPDDLVVYEGPRRPNGSGFTLWFSESKEMAFQRSNYW